MKVLNNHKRKINKPLAQVSKVFKTIATSNDLIWPYENWPAIKFKDGLQVGSRGGHGLIRYTIIDFNAGKYIKFQFSKPDGFIGTHELKLKEVSNDLTEISHEIRMNTTIKGTFLWFFVIRWLHDALIEDAFDNVENYFQPHKIKVTRYNFWVRLLRGANKRKSFQTKHA